KRARSDRPHLATLSCSALVVDRSSSRAVGHRGWTACFRIDGDVARGMTPALSTRGVHSAAAEGETGMGNGRATRTGMPAGCVALLLLQGCAPRGPRALDAEARHSLGAVGVCSVAAAPPARIGGLVGRGKQGAAGAAKNGGLGLAAGVGAG